MESCKTTRATKTSKQKNISQTNTNIKKKSGLSIAISGKIDYKAGSRLWVKVVQYIHSESNNPIVVAADLELNSSPAFGWNSY